MPELLKNLYTREVINRLSRAFEGVWPRFDREKFIHLIFDEEWERRELKQRMRHITLTLNKVLPQDYKTSIGILKHVAPDFNGFIYMFFPDFVEVFGMQYEDESLNALEFFTKYSSSEFAIRPFIKRNPEKVMGVLLTWAEHENHHVRRLASEGCRPRLPWAMALPDFKRDPALILPVLEKLKDDSSEYVRRSVANNLNDISKDNPELVLEIARRWEGRSLNTDWIIRHACRSLLKKGVTQALSQFNFLPPESILISDLNTSSIKVRNGGTLQFYFKIKSKRIEQVKVRIEYGMYFMKSNGKNSRKVFKISEIKLKPDEEILISKNHSFKTLTTRRHYPGNHKVVVILNGMEVAEKEFALIEE